MKKKLDTKFPAARIKKIMQADEEVGKIALATPVLISKALELFLQDLCQRTGEITAARGSKTVSPMHLRACIHHSKNFDFLRDVVANVSDVGGDAGEEKGGSRGPRRRTDDSGHAGLDGDEPKRPRTDEGSMRGGPRSKAKGSAEEVSNGSAHAGACERKPDIATREPDKAAEPRPQPKPFDLNMDVTEDEACPAEAVKDKNGEGVDTVLAGNMLNESQAVGLGSFAVGSATRPDDDDDYDADD